MKLVRNILPILFALAVVLVASCDKYDSWTTSPSAQLTFSADTISFDTVFTTMSSPTRQLLVWNHNDKGVRIEHVFLQGGKDSYFRVNVDGQYLDDGAGEDFEIRRKDSIFVKMEVTLPEGIEGIDNHYEDELVFVLESGVIQTVRLSADGLDVTILRALTVSEDMTLMPDRPYLIYDSLVVAEGATLTLEPGTKLMFHDDVNLIVHGTLMAEGTQEDPIIFRGDRVDNLFDYLPYDNTPNRWGGILFTASSHDNVMVQCDVHSGTTGIYCEGNSKTFTEEDLEPMLYIDNSIIHNIGGYGLCIDQAAVQIIGTQISNTLGHTVCQYGGYSLFVHCTIAQYYPFSADRGHALYLTSIVDEEEIPLYGAYFINSVITGYADDVIVGSITERDEVPQPYLFQNCLLRTLVSNDEQRFINNIYDTKDITPNGTDHFQLIDSNNFLYDFSPVEESQLRSHADMTMTQRYSPIDRLGHSRLVAGGADIGAYQYQPKSESGGQT